MSYITNETNLREQLWNIKISKRILKPAELLCF
jgi:hypothetical protein